MSLTQQAERGQPDSVALRVEPGRPESVARRVERGQPESIALPVERGRPESGLLRVERGRPDDAELAALLVVLAALAGGPLPEPAPVRSAWADPAWRTGAPGRLGPNAWRLAGLPR